MRWELPVTGKRNYQTYSHSFWTHHINASFHIGFLSKCNPPLPWVCFLFVSNPLSATCLVFSAPPRFSAATTHSQTACLALSVGPLVSPTNITWCLTAASTSTAAVFQKDRFSLSGVFFLTKPSFLRDVGWHQKLIWYLQQHLLWIKGKHAVGNYLN